MIQLADQSALVYVEPDDLGYTLERATTAPLGLGHEFEHARHALLALGRARRASTRETPGGM
jgi:hypothetical protein